MWGGGRTYELEPFTPVTAIPLAEFRDASVVSQTESTVIARIPLSRIYISSAGDADGTVIRNTHQNTGITALAPHRRLYDFFSGETADFNSYVQYCIQGALNSSKNWGGHIEITEAWKKNVLQNRKMIYESMCFHWEAGPEFFINNAPIALYEPAAYALIMQSGKHRGALFVHKKSRYMPLKLSVSEYEQWINRPVCNELIAYLEQHNISHTEVPVEHPYFYRFPCRQPRYYTHAVVWVLDFLFECFSGRAASVLDDLEDEGALSRALHDVGYAVTRKSEPTEQTAWIDRLFYTSVPVSSYPQAEVLLGRYGVDYSGFEAPVRMLFGKDKDRPVGGHVFYREWIDGDLYSGCVEKRV